MNEIDIGLPDCYKAVYDDIGSQNLVITFTPTNGFFLYYNDLSANKLCISSTKPNYYLYNVGNTCEKIVKFLKDKKILNIISIGSSKAGLASILWAEILRRKLPKIVKIYSLSFSPQTRLYPFNDKLYFPSYKHFWRTIQMDKSLETCAINYGDLNKVLDGSDLNGMVIYPEYNPTDSHEAKYLIAKNLVKKPLNYSLHGSFLPFMKQAKNDGNLMAMVEKLYENAKKDEDIAATIPESKEALFNLIKSLNVPTIEELCRAIFFKMQYEKEILQYYKVFEKGFIS